MNTLKNLLLIAALSSIAPSIVTAASVPITNGNFEDPTLTSDDTFTSGGINGWSFLSGGGGSQGVERLATSHFASGQPRAIDGNQGAYTNNGPFTFSQNLMQGGNPVDLTANTVYTLTLSIGDRNDTTFTGYSFGLYTTGGTTLVSETNAVTPNDGTWVTRTLTFTALAGNPSLGQALQVRFGNTQTGGQTVFDAMSLDASPVPEPSSVMLLISGAAIVLVARRRC